jgi:hypothetical protein
MSAVTVTPEMAGLLQSLKGSTELRDADGHALGVFTPAAVADEQRLKSLFDLEQAEKDLEIYRDAGRPLKEIWRDLRGSGAAG